MKKFIAILLSVLMLCSVIPFASVAAADYEGEFYVEFVADAEEVNAGDEVTIEVYLYGHESMGMLGAQVEIGFDSDAFELVTYFDEDEEVWMPPIEVGSKFNASSNKYILFAPIDEETGAMERCLVQYLRSSASASAAPKVNLFYTVTFTVKDDAVTGDYTFDFIHYNNKNLILRGADGKNAFAVDGWTWEPITIHVNGADPEPEEPACEHEYNYDCDKNCSKCGEETRPEADHAYLYPCDAYCMYCYELTNEGAAHNEVHVDAVEATCTATGNIEYWYCSDCGASWDANGMPVNRFTVITFGEHEYFNDCDTICMVCGEETREVSHNVIHVDAVAPTCTELGNVEFWYCDVCGAAWLDAECTMVTNMMAVKLGATCATNAEAHEAIEAGCHYTGMNAYWYCANCDVFYADAACTIVTNYKSLVIPALQDSAEYVPAKAATCTENGNVEYWVCYECEQVWADAALTQLTNIKNVQIAPSCSYNAEAHEAIEAGCHYNGMAAYWYCANCDVFYADADCTIVTNYKNLVIPALQDSAEYVPAKDATCDEPGNVEYWVCYECEQVWANEALTQLTNIMNVQIAPTHNVIHVAAKDATCSELGNIEFWYCADCGQAWLDELCRYNTNLMAVKLGTIDHTYTDACDATCNACGAEREVVLPAASIEFGGNSVSENKNGLAFLFTADVDGIIINDNYKADYSNATVIINGEEHKVVAMGAIMNNKGYSAQTLDDVDGTYVLNVKANKVFDDNNYAIRIVNIPAENLDTVITARSYITYECGGELITIYGEDIVASYNGVLG